MPSSDHQAVRANRSYLRSRVVSMLLLSAGLLSLISIFFIFLTQRQQLRHELEQTADNVISRLAFTMALPMWNFDQQYLEQLQDQELQNPAILSVQVISLDHTLFIGRYKAGITENGKQLIESMTGEESKTRVERDALYREKDLIFDSQKLGVVRIVLSIDPIRRKLNILLFQQIGQALILLAGISLLAYIVLEQLVLQPLHVLRHTATAYSQGDLSARANLRNNDELGQLAATLNQMAAEQSRTISELREAEANLHSSNQKLQDIIAFIPDALLVIDTKGIIIAWNRAMEKITGMSAEQMIGKGQHEYALPFYGSRRPILIDLLDLPDEALRSHYTAVHRNGSILSAEATISTNHGQTDTYLWGVATALYDSMGNRCGAIELIRDVTPQKVAEIALKEGAEFRKRIFDSSQTPIVIMDALTYQFIDCNPAATNIYRFSSREETLGKTPADVSPPFQYDGSASSVKAAHYIATALQQGQVIFEWRHQRPDGEQWDAEVHLMSFQSGTRQLLQFTLQDITGRKRTTALMIQTEKMMMVGGLAAGMAHEINNPLGIITQTAQIIQRRLSPDIPANQEIAARFNLDFAALSNYLAERQIPEFLTNIRTATARAAKIITNMLTFSRKSESLFETVEVSQLFEQVLELAASDYDLKKHYGFKQIQIIKEFSDHMPQISVTVVEIEQVLLNLLKNAAQALNEAETPNPVIRLRTRAEKSFAVIDIEDNGPGIPPDVQKRIFEPFFTTKKIGHGTGLGLSISYAIITNNHHGSMEVHSQPGTGTRFTLRLPLSS